MDEVIKVLIVESSALLRMGMAGCLDRDPNVRVVGAVATAKEGYRCADDPDVVLVGTTLADAPGLTVAAELRRRFPASAAIVVTDSESDGELSSAIRAGASAYVGKDVPEEELASLVKLLALVKRTATRHYVIDDLLIAESKLAAHRREQFLLAVRLLGQTWAAGGDSKSSGSCVPLTKRELEILKKVGCGMTNAEVASALRISVHTVKNHLTAILRKLAVNDRTQAVLLGVRCGWLSMDGAAGPTREPIGEVTPASIDVLMVENPTRRRLVP